MFVLTLRTLYFLYLHVSAKSGVDTHRQTHGHTTIYRGAGHRGRNLRFSVRKKHLNTIMPRHTHTHYFHIRFRYRKKHLYKMPHIKHTHSFHISSPKTYPTPHTQYNIHISYPILYHIYIYATTTREYLYIFTLFYFTYYYFPYCTIIYWYSSSM